MITKSEKLKPLDWTGERYLPQVKGDIELEHMHRYLIASKYCAGKSVLDIASGEGYGSNYLAKVATVVTGVDVDALAIENAIVKYVAPNLSFKLGSCSKIPLDDASVDIVVSFETIEHHEEHEEMMFEIKRVLRKNGMLIISCPDKLNYSDVPNYKNPFHKKELYRDEFQNLLMKNFKNIEVSGQKIVFGSGIFGNSKNNRAVCFDAESVGYESESGLNRPVYLLALASDSNLPTIENGIFELPVNFSDHSVRQDNIINHLNQRCDELTKKIAEKCHETELIYNSLSWRLGAPIRFLGRQVRRSFRFLNKIKRFFFLVPKGIERKGGCIRVTSQIFSIFFKSGFAGVKRSIVSFESHVRIAEDYKRWIAEFDTINERQRNQYLQRINEMTDPPLISVIMPTYNSNPVWLKSAIESVKNQIYPFWELCIADDASTSDETKKVLLAYANDPKVKIKFCESNGHISTASNFALSLASGKWITLLDHDDLLTEHALFYLAQAILDNPNVQLVYSDEDKIDSDGVRFSPYFKCDWNVDLFYSHNMFSHLGAFQLNLIKKVGGFREGFEGSQDYDLVLRCIEQISTNEIHHIPKILYHWRVHSLSTASSAATKPYAKDAGQLALKEHFNRLKINANVESLEFNYRVRYAMPEATQPLVSIVIPTRNGLKLLKQCIESIRNKTSYTNYELVIVDNGSDDAATLSYLKKLEQLPGTTVIRDDSEFNYSYLNNEAVKICKGELIALLNNDIEILTDGWLTEMVSIALQPGVGAVGAKLWYPNKTLQHAGVILGVGGVAGHAHKNLPSGFEGYFSRANIIQSFSAVTAACLVVRKKTFELIGGLNAVNLKVAFNDVDFCLRLKEIGLRNIWTPYAEMIHHESASRGSDTRPEKQQRFNSEVEYMQSRWGHILLNDPAYNPNLTLETEDFALAWPPRQNT